MLRHLGTKRTAAHNFNLASLLCLAAGFVNAAGFFAFAILTTNVTGHAALFAERIAQGDWHTARVIALWMFLFLAGAFVSSLIISAIGKNQRFSYFIPIVIEIIILSVVALFGHDYNGALSAKEVYAGSLLFAMGLQNAMVSIVSGSVVRTTHLTGTFTDLGIALAQLYKKSNSEISVLLTRIKLYLAIIFFFMAGALAGAFMFRLFNFNSFFVPTLILFSALIGDIFRIKLSRYYRSFGRKDV